MSVSRVLLVLQAAAAFSAGACGGPGLPPAGPAPGDVDVGYGTRSKEEVTGAVTSLSDSVAPAGPLNLEELLRGRVPGLQLIRGAGGRITFRIRGTNSLQSDQEPLFVVDGVQIPAGQAHTALAGVLPQDVRQIDVLKDVASTSIYGMRGAGGVIIINTRR